MNRPFDSAISEEWNDWYGPADVDNAYAHLHSPDVHDFYYDDPEFQLPLQLPTELFSARAGIENSADCPYVQPSSGYGYVPPHVVRQDSGMLWPAALTRSNAGSPPAPHASNAFGSYGNSNGVVDTASVESDCRQPQQALPYDPPEAIRRAPALNNASAFLDGRLKQVSPSSTSPNSMKRTDPPLQQNADGTIPRRQNPRSASDEYTARWVQGDGSDRAGWCGLCSSWHKLKDSAYWYHMHYTHGISCTTGKEFDKPVKWRQADGAVGGEVLCGSCRQWIYIGRSDRWQTPYFRHAYRCQGKNKIGGRTVRSRPKSTSPRRSKQSEPA